MCIKETFGIYTNPVISKRCKFLKHDDRLENILHCLLRLNWIVLINSVKESYESSSETLNNMIYVSVCGGRGIQEENQRQVLFTSKYSYKEQY